MNKSFKSFLAILLCVSVLFTMSLTPAYALNAQDQGEINDGITLNEYLSIANNSISNITNIKDFFVKVINFLSNFFLNGVLFKTLADLQPKLGNTSVVPSLEDFDIEAYENFYSGTGEFADTPSENAVWSLGYDEQSILPDNFGDKKFARGSYLPWWYSTEVYEDEDGISEDLKVRTIVINDGSGRGNVAFCVLDCIGIANVDVRRIRESLNEFAEENNIVSINISATHTHSGIDSQGVWTQPMTVLANNYLSTIKDSVDLKYGIDSDFLDTLIERTSESVMNAFEDLQGGSLTYAKTDISEYLSDRTPPYALDSGLYRLKFIPFAESATPTIIASFGCHPENTSYDWLSTDDGIEIDTKVSGDFVYYMEKVINKAGYNFIYIQGNVGTVTSSRGNSGDGLPNTTHESTRRYGYELGYITLALTMTTEECIALNEATGDLLGVNEYSELENYTVWYEDLALVEEENVEPLLNVAAEQFLIHVENNVALTLSKTALSSIKLFYDESARKYFTVTEIGYMEIGDSLKVFISPGEIISELLVGGEGLNGFPYSSLRETHGEDLIIFDLMNDAIGYIIPDQNYVIAGFQYDVDKDSIESDTWALLVSMGKKTASTIIYRFNVLVDSVR